jgi:hypothetical protein
MQPSDDLATHLRLSLPDRRTHFGDGCGCGLKPEALVVPCDLLGRSPAVRLNARRRFRRERRHSPFVDGDWKVACAAQMVE